jgi:hypothetical protein
MVALDPQRPREDAHGGQELVVGDVLGKDLEVVELPLVGADRFRFLLTNGGTPRGHGDDDNSQQECT